MIRYINIKSKKWFTLIELIVSMVLTTMLSAIIFSWIQSIINAQNRDRFYRATFSAFSEWLTKWQKIIFENGTTLSWTLNSITDSGSILSFTKEDSYWIEKIYFVNLDKSCFTPTNTIWARLTITDWITNPIKLSWCINTSRYSITQEVKVINSDLKEKVLNFYIYMTNLDDNTITVIKNTIFVK
jgi:type II secretory pathway pseudopilin PulG